MNEKPYINTGDMSESDAKKWILSMAKVADVLGTPAGAFHFLAMSLPSLAESLQDLLDDTRLKINFLESVQIDRSAGRPISVHEELEALRRIDDSLSCAFQIIRKSLELNSEIYSRCYEQNIPDEDS